MCRLYNKPLLYKGVAIQRLRICKIRNGQKRGKKLEEIKIPKLIKKEYKVNA
jgi:hypothetical protein